MDVDQFVEDCLAANRDSEPQTAVLDVLRRVVRTPGGVLAALGEPTEAGIRVLHRSKAYPGERKCVALILDLITGRTGGTREQSLELLLRAYLTGDQEEMNRIFGADRWKRVIDLSRNDDAFQTHRIRKVLED